MATQLNIKNFKSLVDCDITLKPITLLFGPNNNGKSSLINSLFFLSENMTQIHTTNFKLGKENLSSFKEVVSFNDEEKDIVFELKTIVDEEKFIASRKEGIEELRKKYGSEDSEIEKIYDFEESITKRLSGKEIKVNITFSNNVDEKMPLRKLKKIKILLDDKKVLTVNYDKTYFIDDEDGHVSFNLEMTSKNGYIDLFFSGKEKIEEMMKEIFEKHFEILVKVDNTRGFGGSSSLEIIKDFEKKTNKLERKFYQFPLKTQDRIGLERYKSICKPTGRYRYIHLYQYNNFLEYFKREEKYELIDQFTEDVFNQFTEIVYLFSHFMTSQWGLDLPTFNDHVGPIRERPKHKYLINGDIDYSKDFYFDQILGIEFGDEIASAIENAEEVLSYFFEDTSIIMKKDEDIGRLFVRQGDAMFNLAEASSGFLQLLPILIKKPKIIEQPELHLHPKLQAKFADLFVYWLTEKKKEVIVETHSEHILRRLQVLVAEGVISSDDIAVYYFDKKDGETKIINMEMEENGLFKNNWPEGFFDDKANLTFALMEAIKNRN